MTDTTARPDRMKFTKGRVEAVPVPDRVTDRHGRPRSAQTFRWDTEVPGLGVRVSSGGARTYVVQAHVRGGRERRYTIGRHGTWTVDAARRRARQLLTDMDNGIDPVERDRAREDARRRAEVEGRQRGQTLRDAMRAYARSRRRNGMPRKQSTIDDMWACLERYVPDWLDRGLADITPDEVKARHAEVAARGPYAADRVMRYVRGVYNYADRAGRGRDGASALPANPVDALRDAQLWHAPQRRMTAVARGALGPALATLNDIAADPAGPRVRRAAADLVLFMLFTGQRVGEAAGLEWARVDTHERTITLPDPKSRRPTTIPLSAAAFDVVRRRLAQAGPDDVHVFPGEKPGRPVADTRDVCERVRAVTGEALTNHDCKRTFLSTAERLGTGAYTLKRLANHAISTTDVTAGYVVPDLEDLRAAADRVGEYMRECEAAARADNVTAIHAAEDATA